MQEEEEEAKEKKATVQKKENVAWRHEGLSQSEGELQQEARRIVKGIARFKVNRAEFDLQAEALRKSNVVYKEAEYNSALVARWCPDASQSEVPTIVVDRVVAVPTERDRRCCCCERPR